MSLLEFNLQFAFYVLPRWAQQQQQWNGRALLSCLESCFFVQEAFSRVALNRPLDTTSALMLLRCGGFQRWLNAHALCLILKKILSVFNQSCVVFRIHAFFFPPSWYSGVYWRHVLDFVSPARGSRVRLWHRPILASGMSLSELSPLLSFKNTL